MTTMKDSFFKEWEQYNCFIKCLTVFSKAHDSSFIIADAEGISIVVESDQPTRTIFWSAVGSIELRLSDKSIGDFNGSIIHGTVMGKNTPIPLQCIPMIPDVGFADIQVSVIGADESSIQGLNFEWRIDYKIK